ncbi:hypothetical protein L210DRAFT_3539236 [Boletus edulis BED1]|uniref:Uncharacterized protein n=1 Tax=Boletus edulis BED1 TaxID=1328754 RepID=A0AAD4GF58_BOLED|nr:hypothetical protein L210DRAFT_3539236 [Boletus edulis BED1]
MSQSEQPLGAFLVDIVAPDRMDSPFRCLAELVDRAFALSDQHAGSAASSVSPGFKTRFASILYPIGNNDVEPFPVKAVLHPNSPTIIQQVVINFQTKTAECEGHPNLFIEPEQIEYAQEEIKPYLQDVWRRKRAIKKARQLQEDYAWKYFLERLETHGISLPESCSETERCPLCKTPTAVCTSCCVIMCLNRDCAASQLVPFQSCSQHDSTAACLPCLGTANSVPSLGQCPECNLWFCQVELTWCLGRPKDNSNGPPRTYFHRLPNSAREHPIKPIGCFSCTGGQDRLHCSNGKCWSRVRGNTSLCGSCSPGGGLWCTCEQCWICDDCKTSPTDNCFKDCPRCKRVYCIHECEYIHFCTECGRTTLCEDCAEEESIEDVESDATEEVILEGECDSGQSCRGKICGTCLEGTRCAGCGNTYCSSCIHLQRCSRCDGHFCSACYRACQQRCDGCDDGVKT